MSPKPSVKQLIIECQHLTAERDERLRLINLCATRGTA
jgi:hypothetical protein